MGDGTNGGMAPGERGITEASGGVATLTRSDFVSDQEVRWCPGCGDYAILAAVQSVMPELGIPREKIVFVSGIGCSSRFPYYMNTYGIHGIHGRAPAIATGVATARPDLQVWVVTGDGDGMSIGGNHLIHALRRNVNLKILLFNNQIYGLTKGQYSPTSEKGKVTKSTPFGSLETPFNPISLALASEATFVARTYDVERRHLPNILRRAAAHRGSAFVEIYQNCNIFNDGAFLALTAKGGGTNRIYLEDGKPIRFGADHEKGIVMRPDGSLEVVNVKDVGEEKLLVHDEHREDPSLAYALSRIASGPTMPTPMGFLDRSIAPCTAMVWSISCVPPPNSRDRAILSGCSGRATPGASTRNGEGGFVSDITDEKVEKLAQKLLRAGDPAAPDIDAARRSARRMLEDSEERTFDPAAHDHEADGVIRRSSSETAATGETGQRWTSDGE